MRALVAIGAGALVACAAGIGAQPAEPSAGERAFQKCFSCHSVQPGEARLTGPNLAGIVGRRVAIEPGFDYSTALRDFARGNPVWSRELLDRYIADPEALVPGTSMAFNGIPDPAERAALIGFLGQTSASAANLP